MEVIAFVQIDHPVRLVLSDEVPDGPPDVGQGLAIGPGSGEIAIEIGLRLGEFRQVARSRPESGLVGPRQDHEATTENRPVADLFRGPRSGWFIPMQAAGQEDGGPGLGALDHMVGSFPLRARGKDF